MRIRIVGPPGTGKTTELLNILEREVSSGVDPKRIAFLTFTRAARKEALARTGKSEGEFPLCKTIHSICYHQLAVSKDQVVRPENLREFGKEIGIKLTGANFDPWIEEFERGIDPPTREDFLLQANHCGRHRKIHLKEALQELSTDIDYFYAVWFTKAYRNWKTSYGLLDYTDLLDDFLKFGKPLDIDVIFVDEAQDLSRLQWDVVNLLGAGAQRFYVAGDDDQAIFHWAGADSNAFQDIIVDENRTLTVSHRVSKSVYSLAMDVAHRINKRIPKEYSPRDSEGLVQDIGFLGNADLNQQTFILFRNHYRGAVFAQFLREQSIPFIGKGSPLTNSDARVAVYAWYQLLAKGEANVEVVKRFLRYADPDYIDTKVYNLVKERKVLKAREVFFEVPKIEQWYKILKELPGKDVVAGYIKRHGFVRTALPKVELLSIHQSKGREAHTVVIDPEMSKAVWLSMIKNSDDEHRVWYVAVTRAKERVFFLLPDGSYSYKF